MDGVSLLSYGWGGKFRATFQSLVIPDLCARHVTDSKKNVKPPDELGSRFMGTAANISRCLSRPGRARGRLARRDRRTCRCASCAEPGPVSAGSEPCRDGRRKKLPLRTSLRLRGCARGRGPGQAWVPGGGGPWRPVRRRAHPDCFREPGLDSGATPGATQPSLPVAVRPSRSSPPNLTFASRDAEIAATERDGVGWRQPDETCLKRLRNQ